MSRILLLAFILLAFLRLTWGLDAKALWWDESLSLQRAESSWSALLRGTLLIQDGMNGLATTDQHPFTFFVLLSLLIHLAGESEFVLRFPSVISATLLVPLVWVMATNLSRRQIVAPSTPLWGVLFASLSPFYLWYGQEARPYVLWAALALLSTYLLWRATAPFTSQPWEKSFEDAEKRTKRPAKSGESPYGLLKSPWAIGYIVSLSLYLTTHYYALFLLPLHALLIWRAVMAHNRRLAYLLAGAIAVVTVVGGSLLGWYLLSRTGGENFDRIPVSILLPDLLNANSMGLSVDINQVWWLDLLMGAIALLGAGWAVRSWHYLRENGWVVAGLVLIPILVLLAINAVQPAYMNARHMSLIGGGYLLALGAGIALIWERQRWLALLLALLISGGAAYSTHQYFTNEIYDKDDYRGLAAYLAPQMQPGDLLLLQPAASWRIFHYYLPLERIDAYNRQAEANSVQGPARPTHYYGAPLLWQSWEANFAQLTEWKSQYRRIWHVRSGTNPFIDPDGQVETWLNENMYRIQEKRFFSHSALRANLYMAVPPVYNEPIEIEGTPLSVNFGDQIRLVGINIERPLTNDSSLPITLTWQTFSDTDLHYKSVLRLVKLTETGEEIQLGITEREPYDGTISTAFWAPNQTIVEYTEILSREPLPDSLAGWQLRIQIYPTETFEKAPIIDGGLLPGNMQVGDDGQTIIVRLE